MAPHCVRGGGGARRPWSSRRGLFWCWPKRAGARFLAVAATTIASSSTVLLAVTVARLLDPTISLPASLISAKCRTRISRVCMTPSVGAVLPWRDRGSLQSACAHRTPHIFRISPRRCDTFFELSTLSTPARARGLRFRVPNAWQRALATPHFIPGPSARASSADVRRSAAKAKFPIF